MPKTQTPREHALKIGGIDAAKLSKDPPPKLPGYAPTEIEQPESPRCKTL